MKLRRSASGRPVAGVPRAVLAAALVVLVLCGTLVGGALLRNDSTTQTATQTRASAGPGPSTHAADSAVASQAAPTAGIPAQGTAPRSPQSAAGANPASWPTSRLAAQLVFTCSDAASPATLRRAAQSGAGGLVLLGKADGRLAAYLRTAAKLDSPQAPMFVASDEEGGLVQRLSRAIYPLPRPADMESWSTDRIAKTSRDYALRMRRLGVTMSLAPVADTRVAGSYLDRQGRSFSADPTHVRTAAGAWATGLRKAGVVSVVKHWPGHGGAGNTHIGAGSAAPIRTLEERDLLPFRGLFADGVPAVMVSHVRVPQLTEPNRPATLSPAAMSYLRRQAGPDRVILTDDLGMDAASSDLGITPVTAAVRAVQAGADMAMVCAGGTSPATVAHRLQRAMAEGQLARGQVLGSVRRILRAKQTAGLR